MGLSDLRRVLILAPGGDRVWLTPAGAAWQLPAVRLDAELWWQEVAPLNRAVREQLGLGASTLACARIGDSPENTPYYALELEGEGPAGPGRWAGVDALTDLPAEARQVAADWLTAAGRVPWSRPGWRTEALDWARQTLTGLGRPPLAAPEQVRAWERSALWRFETAAGPAYFKAAPEAFPQEARLSQALAAWAPTAVAPVLAADPERNWMLLGSAGAESLLRNRELAHWEAALRQYADLQIALADRTQALLALGVPDRRWPRLGEEIDALLADTAALQATSAGLSNREVADLRRRAAEFRAAGEALALSPLPASLEHGDLASGQIVTDGQGYRFIDWSDAAVAHPFLSLLFFWAELEGSFDDVAAARERLRDAYLAPWSAYGAPADLRAWFAQAQCVAPLYYASLYHRHILPRMRARWEMERMLPYYLRFALRPA